jgi:hypothetical protein
LWGACFDRRDYFVAAGEIRPSFCEMKMARAIRLRISPRICLFSGFLLVAGSAPLSGQPNVAVPAGTSAANSKFLPPHEEANLVIDAASKQQTVKPGQESCVFVFAVKNVSNLPITIVQVRTSCGCTIATLPSKPWTLAPGVGGEIKLTLDLRGKSGTVSKSAIIETLTGIKNLEIKAVIPNS